MPTTETLAIRELRLDLNNFRTVPQATEADALGAMISISPDRFWALMESLLDSRYLPTENILVLRSLNGAQGLVVKEGNRRVAALKLAHGLLDRSEIKIPEAIEYRLDEVSSDWLADTATLPCVVFKDSDAARVDGLVTLTHGKGQKAGREDWTAVARARHNRKANAASEPALDLLEEYLRRGKNHTTHQAQRWAGKYPVTVLEEALKRIAGRLGLESARQLADSYPLISHREAVEDIARDIGLGKLGFPKIRSSNDDFAATYGIPETKREEDEERAVEERNGDSQEEKDDARGTSKNKTKTGDEKRKASSSRTPQAVKALIRGFTPLGSGREKVVLLRDEVRALNLNNNPLAFCFLVLF